MSYALADQVYYQILDDQVVVADFVHNRLIVLNRPGGLLWRQLVSGSSPAAADNRSTAFVKQLVQRGLLTKRKGVQTASIALLEAEEDGPGIVYQAGF